MQSEAAGTTGREPLGDVGRWNTVPVCLQTCDPCKKPRALAAVQVRGRGSWGAESWAGGLLLADSQHVVAHLIQFLLVPCEIDIFMPVLLMRRRRLPVGSP